VLAGFPHATLIRPTYPELQDHPSVAQHPPLRGVADNVVFIQHVEPEDSIEDAKIPAQSKTNKHEVGMVAAVVKHLSYQAGGLLRTSTGPSLNLLLLLREYV
jgi:hypothetical protein